jgi:hypothetical protein
LYLRVALNAVGIEFRANGDTGTRHRAQSFEHVIRHLFPMKLSIFVGHSGVVMRGDFRVVHGLSAGAVSSALYGRHLLEIV